MEATSRMTAQGPLPAPPGQPLPGATQTDATSTAPTSTPVSRRIRGLDAARALAIIGMVMVHFGPVDVDVDEVAGFFYETSHGRASLLFIVLAGVGVSLLAGNRSPARLRGTTQRLLYRAAVLFPVGLALQALGTRVAVILQYYAVYFLFALPALRRRDRTLLLAALAITVLAPVLYVATWFWQPDWFAVGRQPSYGEPVVLVRALLLTGYYPAIVWSAPLLFGMWLGRRDLRDPRVRRALLAGGAAAAALAYGAAWALTSLVGAPPEDAPSWRWLVVAEPHSEMPLWLVGGAGVACAVIAASLYAADMLPRLTWPLVAAGQLALSLYVGHLFVLAWWPEWLVRADVPAAAVSVARFAAVSLLLATLWRAVFPRGPLETVLHLPFWRR